MYDYISGTVARIAPHVAVVDAGGIGYLCHVSLPTQAKLTAGQPGRLYIWLCVREDALELFGFADPRERDCFLMLLGISGVGPKASLSLLSALTPEKLAVAVMTGDERALTAASGVGKKLAQRILLELKDKLGAGEAREFLDAVPALASAPGAGGKLQEALGALTVLGCTPSESAAALRGVDIEGLPLEEIIRIALKNMAQ